MTDSRGASDREAAANPPPLESTPAGASTAHAAAAPPDFLVVGIGASAGGLEAFEAFFSGFAPNSSPGMAFVLVQHLAPDQKSLLVELIGRRTTLPVSEVVDGVPVRPDRVYVVPPGFDMALHDGALRLFAPTEARGRRLPIDFFLRSLARDRRERAVGVVLSGNGADGTEGLRAVADAGGLVLAQDVASADFKDMPTHAAAAVGADGVCPPAEMAARLVAYAARVLDSRREAASATEETAIRSVLERLRARTGHDFSLYKANTVCRRIVRRMAVLNVDSAAEYAERLERNPSEADALLRDLLIGVTSFFRDAGAFSLLEERVIPELLARRTPGATIRVWTAGCSTGEEAYSLAMLLVERIEALRAGYALQVFATDIDARAVAAARAGEYPAGIAAELSPERLARFFSLDADGGTYRVRKCLRDLVVFSEQDVVRDPPFSRLDLISCRNLMIYMGSELQRKLVPLFYYALKPDGCLFLGTSEGVGDFGELFEPFDRGAKVYRRKPDVHGRQRAALGRFFPPMTGRDAEASPTRGAAPAVGGTAKSLRDVVERALLTHFDPAAALVDAAGDVLYLHGRTGRYLEPSPGEAGVNNVLRMARDGLRRELTVALRRSAESGDAVVCHGLRVATEGRALAVVVSVRPTAAGPSHGGPLFLVVFETASAADEGPAQAERPAAAAATEPSAPSEVAALIAGLREELRAKEERLRYAAEDLDRSAEERRSSNEELQSMNEELQSANEELETSKEELQSVNEELATVNAELHAKVADLSRANGDMNNLLAGTGIGTVFVDLRLRILRFTPAASVIINLIPSDVGRPVSHLVSNLVDYDRLVEDVQSVLATLTSKEIEVRTKNGRAYVMRIQPYRTLENVIEGAVVSFVDVTDAVAARDALRKADDLLRLAPAARDARDAVVVHDLRGRVLSWNAAATRLYGWSEAEALDLTVLDRVPPDLRGDAAAALLRAARAGDLLPFRTRRAGKDGAALEVSVVTTPLVDAAGAVYATASIERAVDGGAA
jgi:two-component system CheB/CheR fusion protein